MPDSRPNIVFFQVDNLGYGELGCYGGGVLRGADTKRIDGKDQSSFLYGRQEESNREGFLFWNRPRPYGVKWRNFKLALIEQSSMFDPAPDYGVANCRNLIWDPKETLPIEPRYWHTWTAVHFSRLIREFQESVKREPLIPAGAPLDFVPQADESRHQAASHK